MKRFLTPKIVIPVLVVLVMLGTVAYVLLAPATWWRPFYVRMEMDDNAENSPAAQAAGGEGGMPAQPGIPSSVDDLQASNIQQAPGIMYRLDNKVVNLAEPGGLRYLQASVVLELWPLTENYYMLEGEERDQAKEEFEKLIDARRPIIDDIVTTQLSSKTFNEIATIEGKQTLKEELMTAINDALGYEGVVNVYFTNFVVQ